MKLLWLSRHALTADQLAGLNPAVEVTTVNMTFPAKSWEAVEAIIEAAAGFDAIAGVFPAHIAAAIVRHAVSSPEEGVVNCFGLFIDGRYVPVLAPVSQPVFAVDGEPRGFAHSHWEALTR